MSWIINGLAFVGCLTLIATALLAWAVWRDDTPRPDQRLAAGPRHQTGPRPRRLPQRCSDDEAGAGGARGDRTAGGESGRDRPTRS